jgi:hypothetical protein
VSVAAAESDPVDPSAPDGPPSTVASASSLVTASPTLPSLAESLRPELLSPQAAARIPSAPASRTPGTALVFRLVEGTRLG